MLTGVDLHKLLIVGHSHSIGVVNALRTSGVPTGYAAPREIDGHGVFTFDGSRFSYSSPIKQEIESQFSDPIPIISMVGGNAYNVLGLIEGDPPFDFLHPSYSRHLREDCAVIPYRTVHDSFWRRLQAGDLRMLTTLIEEYPTVFWGHVQAPPPWRDNAAMEAHLDPYFRQNFPNRKISDPWLRLKLWKTESDIFEAACLARGKKYLRVPREALDPDGFLRPEYHHETSCTHANAAYSSMVYEQIKEALL